MKIELAPSLDKFVEKKIRNGDFLDAGEVVRESLRRWKEQEECLGLDERWLEAQIQAGCESEDLRGGRGFWNSLRKELHREFKDDSKRR
jgi:putative addiction module CopG family antidote